MTPVVSPSAMPSSCAARARATRWRGAPGRNPTAPPVSFTEHHRSSSDSRVSSSEERRLTPVPLTHGKQLGTVLDFMIARDATERLLTVVASGRCGWQWFDESAANNNRPEQRLDAPGSEYQHTAVPDDILLGISEHLLEPGYVRFSAEYFATYRLPSWVPISTNL